MKNKEESPNIIFTNNKDKHLPGPIPAFEYLTNQIQSGNI